MPGGHRSDSSSSSSSNNNNTSYSPPQHTPRTQVVRPQTITNTKQHRLCGRSREAHASSAQRRHLCMPSTPHAGYVGSRYSLLLLLLLVCCCYFIRPSRGLRGFKVLPVVVILYVARYAMSVRADTWSGAAAMPASESLCMGYSGVGRPPFVAVRTHPASPS